MSTRHAGALDGKEGRKSHGEARGLLRLLKNVFTVRQLI